MLKFFIPIAPYPKRTGTIALVGRKPRFIANKETKKYEASIKSFLRDTNMKGKMFDKTLPLKIEATFYMNRPKSVKRSVHTVKPDVDNLAKSLLDGLEGYFFEGDQQVTCLQLRKVYAADNDSVGTMVTITIDEEN